MKIRMLRGCAMIIGGPFSDEIPNDIKNHPLIDDVYPYFSF